VSPLRCVVLLPGLLQTPDLTDDEPPKSCILVPAVWNKTQDHLNTQVSRRTPSPPTQFTPASTFPEGLPHYFRSTPDLTDNEPPKSVTLVPAVWDDVDALRDIQDPGSRRTLSSRTQFASVTTVTLTVVLLVSQVTFSRHK
jgi:hypothetical protein